MSKEIKFSNKVLSRVNSIYSSVNLNHDKPCDSSMTKYQCPCLKDILNKNVSIKLFGQEFTLKMFQESLFDQPFVHECKISEQIVNDIIQPTQFDNHVKKVLNHLFQRLQNTQEIVHLTFKKIKHFDNVTFKPAVLKNNKFTQMGFVLKVPNGQLKANTKYTFNTGYIINQPISVKKRRFIDVDIVNADGSKKKEKKLVIEKEFSKQIPFVIIPTIQYMSGLIPTLYCKDADDTGFVTINFTVLKDIAVEKIFVRMIACSINTGIVNPANIINHVNTKSLTVTKKRDQVNTRTVFNFKTKFRADSMKLINKQCVQFDTFSPVQTTDSYENQKLQINLSNGIVLFSSRKRETHDPTLITMAGVFVPNHVNENIKPLVLHTGPGHNFLHNTHCVSYLSSIVQIYNEEMSQIEPTCKILNGAFKNLHDYTEVMECMKNMIKISKEFSLHSTSIFNMHVKYPTYDLNKLLLIFDHQRQLTDKKVKEFYFENDEEKIFRKKIPFSVTCLTSMKNLAILKFHHVLTPNQIDYLKATAIYNEEEVENLKLSDDNTNKNENENIASNTIIPIVNISNDATSSSNDIILDNNNNSVSDINLDTTTAAISTNIISDIALNTTVSTTSDITLEDSTVSTTVNIVSDTTAPLENKIDTVATDDEVTANTKDSIKTTTNTPNTNIVSDEEENTITVMDTITTTTATEDDKNN